MIAGGVAYESWALKSPSSIMSAQAAPRFNPGKIRYWPLNGDHSPKAQAVGQRAAMKRQAFSRSLILRVQAEVLMTFPTKRNHSQTAVLFYRGCVFPEKSGLHGPVRDILSLKAGLCLATERAEKWQSHLKSKSGSVRRKSGRKTTGQTDGMMSFGIRPNEN
jgi:hypothetical protein